MVLSLGPVFFSHPVHVHRHIDNVTLIPPPPTGGVFIATLIGLALAMVALAAEVLYYKRGSSTTIVNDIHNMHSKKALKLAAEKEQVARINVTPVY